MEVRSNCRCCTAGCGMVAEVVDRRVLSVRGDTEHPLSRGYLCPKGTALPWSHHRETRLDTPTIRGVAVSWPEMLDDLARRIHELVRQHGGDSIGWYEGTGTATDNFGKDFVVRLLTGLGSTQDYSAATIDIAPAWRMAQLVAGSNKLLPRWVPEDELSTIVIWLGGNPTVSHGYMTSLPDPVRRIKAFQRRGGHLWVVDPRRTRTAGIADRHLAIRPGSDHALLAFLLRAVLEIGPFGVDFVESTTPSQRAAITRAVAPFTTDETAARTNVPRDLLVELRDEVLDRGRMAVVSGTGLTFQRHAIENEWLRWTLLLATDSLDQPGGMWFNPQWLEAFDLMDAPLPEPWEALPPAASRPDLSRVSGEIPVVAMADEIDGGHLQGLFVNGGNPMSAFPDPARTREVFSKLELLVVADVAESATTQVATHVLPVAGQLERMDYIPSAWAMASPAVVQPGADRRPTWWVAAQLGARLGLDLFAPYGLAGVDPDAVTERELMAGLLATGRQDAGDLLAAGSHGIRVPTPTRFMRERVLPNARWNILPSEMEGRLEWLAAGGSALSSAPPSGRSASAADFVFINGRQLTRNCSTAFVPEQKSGDQALATLHPDDLAVLGVVDGDLVRITGLDGTVEIPVRGNSSITPGAVWIPQGWVEHNTSDLCSYTRDVDPLTGQPAMTGLPVRLERVAVLGTVAPADQAIEC